MQFCLPPDTKSTGKWRQSGDPFRLVAWYHFYLLSCLHYGLIKLINPGFCPLLLIVATPRIKDRDLVVSATAAPTIIPLGNAVGELSVSTLINQTERPIECPPLWLCWQTRNRFESTRSEVECLMRKMKENPHEHKSVSQHTMEGYLFVQEKRTYQPTPVCALHLALSA